jgi:hypothetical protein
MNRNLPQQINSAKEVVDILEPLIAELENKINDCRNGGKTKPIKPVKRTHCRKP